MKRHILFLSVIACLSLSSVSCSASPPFEEVVRNEPLIKQSVAVEPQSVFAITPIEYSMEVTAANLTEQTFLNIVKPSPLVQSVCTAITPFIGVDGRAVLTWRVKNCNYHRILDLGFHYSEGRATEYRC